VTRAFVALGSNLDDPPAQLRRAVKALGSVPLTRLLRVSSVWRSAPVGPAGQPDYLNAAVLLETALTAHELFDALQAIEDRQGRVRAERWGPRTLDLDLLLFGNVRIDDQRLTVPHPRMRERDWVLYPLREISDTTLVMPGGADIATLLAACQDNHLVRTQYRLSEE
jgi:2-amino-4-hydroxy-6-hydroxymethyldihydropteridine diphosphokinase